MNADICVETAVPGDAPEIARQCAGVQNNVTLPLTIWSSPSVWRYVEDLISGRLHDFRMVYYVLRVRGRIEGFISLRDLPGRILFDNVYMSPFARKNQLSAWAIHRCALMHLESNPVPEFAWDVWTHDRALRIWYRQLGGIQQYRRYWYRLIPNAGGPAGTVRHAPAEVERHQRYGFSMLDVETATRRHAVGLLCDHAYRITDDEALNDPQLLPALAAYDPQRRLYVSSANPELPGAEPAVASTNRQHTELEGFLVALQRTIPSEEKQKCILSS
jgi:hypothetical protein